MSDWHWLPDGVLRQAGKVRIWQRLRFVMCWSWRSVSDNMWTVRIERLIVRLVRVVERVARHNMMTIDDGKRGGINESKAGVCVGL